MRYPLLVAIKLSVYFLVHFVCLALSIIHNGIEEITLKQDESKNVSGIGTGALIVLRSAISEGLIPISSPQETTCCNWFSSKKAGLTISDDTATAGKLDVLAGKICRQQPEKIIR